MSELPGYKQHRRVFFEKWNNFQQSTEALEGHFYLLIITYYLLLITYHLLLITYYLLLITYCLLLITYHITGPRSAVSNVSGNRCESDCRSRGRKFDPGPVPYFRGDWSWNYFYGHPPPVRWIIQEGLLSVTSEIMCTKYWFELAQENMWLGELTIPQWQ